MPRSKRHGVSSSAHFAAMEALEPRQMLAADLTAAIDSAKLPADTISGDGTKITIPVIVTNAGPDALASDAVADIRISLRPADAVDSSQDIEIVTLQDQKLGALKATKAKKINAKITLAAGIDTDNYVFVADVDTGGQVAESDDANNSATSAPIAVTEGFVNLKVTLVAETLPTDILEDSNLKGNLVVNVTNEGNIALPKGQTINLRMIGEPTGGGVNYDFGTLVDQSVSGLKPGASKKITFKVNQLAEFEGEHQIKVLIDTDADVAESNEGDNELTLPETITASPAFTDLAVTSSSEDLGLTVETGATGDALVVITNEGNTDVNGAVDIEVFATEAGTIDGESVRIGVLTTTLKLKPGQASKALKVPLTVGGGLDGGYTLVTRVSPGDGSGLEDTDPQNDVLSGEGLTVTEIEPALGALWGNRMKFKKTGGFSQNSPISSIISEQGTFVDEQGRTGTYNLNWTQAPQPVTNLGNLTMTYDDTNQADHPGQGSFSFNGFVNLQSLNNKTIRFELAGVLTNAWGGMFGDTVEFGVN